MGIIRTPATLADIQQVVQQIVERFRPRKVFLFGSYAYGEPTADSDVDLLIEMETPLRNVEQAVEIRKRGKMPKGAGKLLCRRVTSFVGNWGRDSGGKRPGPCD